MNIVNGKQVENLIVKKTSNGYEIHYSELFDVGTATVEQMILRLRKNNIEPVISRDEYNKIIIIYLKESKDIYGAIHSLNIENRYTYDVNYEDNILTIDLL